MRFPSRRYFCSSFAPFSSQSLTRPSMKSALLLLITGVMVQLSCSRTLAMLRSKPALLTSSTTFADVSMLELPSLCTLFHKSSG